MVVIIYLFQIFYAKCLFNIFINLNTCPGHNVKKYPSSVQLYNHSYFVHQVVRPNILSVFFCRPISYDNT